jgi:hypothetical protein
VPGRQYNGSPLLVVRKEAGLSLKSGRLAPYRSMPKASLGPNGQWSLDSPYQSPDSYLVMPGCVLTLNELLVCRVRNVYNHDLNRLCMYEESSQK